MSFWQKRWPIPVLCLLLAILAACAAFLLRWRRSKAAAMEPAPVQAIQSRAYISKFRETPVPTLPLPYLSSPAPTPVPGATPAPAPAADGLLGGKYAWRFSSDEILTDHTYSDPTVSISWDVYRDEINYDRPVTFFIADVLVQDVSSFRTAFSKSKYNLGGTSNMEDIARSNNCIVAISGDFSRWHENGLIVRNGEVFRDQRFTSDLCVLYGDGTMETYEPGTITNQEILDKGPWQSWHFGPEYCLVLVDGRQGNYSGGLNMQELSELMHALGCVRAYNLDGGATAHMTWRSEVINSPSKDRKVHDVICVCFPSKA